MEFRARALAICHRVARQLCTHSPRWLAGSYTCLACPPRLLLPPRFFLRQQAHLLSTHSDTDRKCWCLPLISRLSRSEGSFGLQHSAQVGVFLPVPSASSLFHAKPRIREPGLESSRSAISEFLPHHPCPAFSLCLDVPMTGAPHLQGRAILCPCSGHTVCPRSSLGVLRSPCSHHVGPH